MRNLINIILLAMLLNSCKEEEVLVVEAGSINVTNAVLGGASIKLISENSAVSGNNNSVNVNASVIMPLAISQTNLTLGIPATNTVPSTIYYSSPITVSRNETYSLFLTGASTSSVESIFIKEAFTYTYPDSICGVRFINLAQGNNPINVNIKGNSNGSEVTNLQYKAYSGFKMYAAKKSNPSYIFEFRRLDGSLITTYTLATPYFHNVTLALRGTVGGTTGVILCNNYQ